MTQIPAQHKPGARDSVLHSWCCSYLPRWEEILSFSKHTDRTFHKTSHIHPGRQWHPILPLNHWNKRYFDHKCLLLSKHCRDFCRIGIDNPGEAVHRSPPAQVPPGSSFCIKFYLFLNTLSWRTPAPGEVPSSVQGSCSPHR